MKPEPGTYALILRCMSRRAVAIGRLGALRLCPGYFVYVGSAFGTGGVRARIAHHRRLAPRPRWHIDYLRPHVELEEVWFTHDPVRREHQWSDVLAHLGGSIAPLHGFGSSDCSCPTHLYYFPLGVSRHAFSRPLHRSFPNHASLFAKRALETESHEHGRAACA